jgi:GNAT superfamily N-acetyltransferase
MNLEEIKFEKLTLEDLGELKTISRQTYYDTFSWGNSAENMQSYLDSALSEKMLSTELRNKNSHFYFAKHKGYTIGYLKINLGSAQTDIKDEEAMELERIYVLKQFQGKGFGRILLIHIIELAKSKGLKYLWLGVWEKNEKAIQFYTRHNFKFFGSHSFTMGDEIQKDHLLKLSL